MNTQRWIIGAFALGLLTISVPVDILEGQWLVGSRGIPLYGSLAMDVLALAICAILWRQFPSAH